MKLYKKIILIQSMIILVTMILSGLNYYTSTSKIYYEQSKIDCENMSSRLAGNLVEPLWNYNNEVLLKQLRTELQNEDVRAIIIDQTGTKSGLIKDRDFTLQDFEEIQEYQELLLESSMSLDFDVVKENETLASVIIYYHDYFIRQVLSTALIGICIQILVLAVILTFTTYSLLVVLVNKPLKQITTRIQEIARGEGDLTKKTGISRKDEIGVLAKEFDSFVGELMERIVNVKTGAVRIHDVMDTLGANSEETAASTVQINRNIETMKEQMKTLDKNIDGSTNAVSGITGNIRDLNSHIENQSSAVEESTASVNQMVASLDNVAKITHIKMEATEKLVETARNGGDKLSQTTSAVTDINDNVDSISKMVDIINAIAAQTNLLAMNAAIEAAHAGNAGKGFSVVADEIRKLAETSSQNAKEISAVLQKIIEKIIFAKNASQETSIAFNEIDNGVMEVSKAFSEISSSTNELSIGGKEIIEAMSLLNSISSQVKEGADSMTSSADTVLEGVHTVRRISSEVLSGIEEAVIGTSEVQNSMGEIRGLSGQLESASATLNEGVGKFKTE